MLDNNYYYYSHCKCDLVGWTGLCWWWVKTKQTQRFRCECAQIPLAGSDAGHTSENTRAGPLILRFMAKFGIIVRLDYVASGSIIRT